MIFKDVFPYDCCHWIYRWWQGAMVDDKRNVWDVSVCECTLLKLGKKITCQTLEIHWRDTQNKRLEDQDNITLPLRNRVWSARKVVDLMWLSVLILHVYFLFFHTLQEIIQIPGLSWSDSLPVLGHILFVGSKRMLPCQLPLTTRQEFQIMDQWGSLTWKKHQQLSRFLWNEYTKIVEICHQ